MITLTNKCDWCSDSTCDDYWRVVVFGKLRRICNCCYEHLRKETKEEREEQWRLSISDRYGEVESNKTITTEELRTKLKRR